MAALGIRALALAPLAGAAVWACLPADSAPRQTDEPTVEAAPAKVETGTDTTVARDLRVAGRWGGEPPLPFALALDRAAAREASLAARAERRAYDGAPPVMPHSASFGEGTKECLDCHTDGMRLGDRVAHPMSHAPLPNCLQCHVQSRSLDLAPAPPPDNAFVGHRAEPAAPDVVDGVPPSIPHDVHMRGRCLSCHGEFGYPGLRTSHPERAVCVQCHVPTRGGPR